MAARKQYQLLSPGDFAPGFRLPRLEGGQVSLGDLVSNGPALLAFYKTSCPVCQMTMPFLERLHEAGTLPIYAISQSDSDDTREFNAEFGITLPTLLDPEESGFAASNDYGISHVPTMYLIGAGGKILNVIESWNRQELEKLASSVGVTLIRATDNVPAFRSG
jgi:peroxiredoxin